MKHALIFLLLSVVTLTSSGQTNVFPSDNNVGIGTITPATKLEIKNSATQFIKFDRDGVSKNAHIGYGANNEGGLYLGTDDNLYTLWVQQNGNVGIGTTAPSYKLQTNGDILANGGWLRVTGQRGIYFQTYGGGFYMVDATWIRTFNNRSFYHNTGVMRTDGTFQVGPGGDRFLVNSSGNVGIGTSNPGAFKLAVNGKIRAKEVVVETNWADFVFKPNYKLKPLSEVEEFIKANGHLPDLPSETEVLENGIGIGETNTKLLQKIEELTLYLLKMNKRITSLENENTILKKTIGNENENN